MNARVLTTFAAIAALGMASGVSADQRGWFDTYRASRHELPEGSIVSIRSVENVDSRTAAVARTSMRSSITPSASMAKSSSPRARP